MEWHSLTTQEQVDQIVQASYERPVVIFKHSTRCSISHMAKSRLERSGTQPGIDFYYLDLLNHRNLSNLLSAKFDVYHESPQVLLIRQGECTYDESHGAIDMLEIVEQSVQSLS